MRYRARTLTGRIALHFGVRKSQVRDAFLVATMAVTVLIALLLSVR